MSTNNYSPKNACPDEKDATHLARGQHQITWRNIFDEPVLILLKWWTHRLHKLLESLRKVDRKAHDAP